MARREGDVPRLQPRGAPPPVSAGRQLRRAAALLLAGAVLAPALHAQRARKARRKPEPVRPLPPLVRLVVRGDTVESSPATVRAGVVRVRLVNRDSAWHDAVVVRLGDLAGTDSVPAAGAVAAGGAALVAGGDSSEAAFVLEAGRWAVTARHDDTTRAARVATLAVQPRPAADTRPAMRGATLVAMQDFRFDHLEQLREGTQVLRVRNDGQRPHELVVYRMLSGRTLRDFGTWYTTSREGPPPALPVGGATMVAPGREAWAVLHLRPGRYFMVCKVPEGGQMHAALGMVQAFEVP